YLVIDKIAHASGISYSIECGANIGPESETIWEDYIKVFHLLFLLHYCANYMYWITPKPRRTRQRAGPIMKPCVVSSQRK
ncbi:hypothetical protein BDR07DRAFT_1310347, partial [Suillus spraguei]